MKQDEVFYPPFTPLFRYVKLHVSVSRLGFVTKQSLLYPFNIYLYFTINSKQKEKIYVYKMEIIE